MPRQTSLQLTEATDRQVEALSEAGFGRLTDIVRLAVDRMHRQEMGKMDEAGLVEVLGRLRATFLLRARTWRSENGNKEATPQQILLWEGMAMEAEAMAEMVVSESVVRQLMGGADG